MNRNAAAHIREIREIRGQFRAEGKKCELRMTCFTAATSNNGTNTGVFAVTRAGASVLRSADPFERR